MCLPGYWNGSLVAVKVLEQVAGDCDPRSSLEPLLHQKLSHPNVVAMFDICTQVMNVYFQLQLIGVVNVVLFAFLFQVISSRLL
jgi:hypothetical protein